MNGLFIIIVTAAFGGAIIGYFVARAAEAWWDARKYDLNRRRSVAALAQTWRHPRR